jgi:hypothetical protein
MTMDLPDELAAMNQDVDLIHLDFDLYTAMKRPEWTDQAVCRDVENQQYLETMYPERHETPGGKHLIPARKLCLVCPVRYQCLDVGLEEQFGIWGGHSLSQRRRIQSLLKSGSSLVEASQLIDSRSRDAR